jgi:hypothetical protein
MDGVGGHVCGELICAICSTDFGNEDGVYRCVSHSNGDAADPVENIIIITTVTVCRKEIITSI